MFFWFIEELDLRAIRTDTHPAPHGTPSFLRWVRQGAPESVEDSSIKSKDVALDTPALVVWDGEKAVVCISLFPRERVTHCISFRFLRSCGYGYNARISEICKQGTGIFSGLCV